jgi:rod shape-determining protein MreD
MKFSIILLLITFLLEGVLSNYLSNIMFILVTLIIIEPYIFKNKNYYLIAFILGLTYDLAYTSTFLLNAILLLILSLVIRKIHLHFSLNLMSVPFIITFSIIIHRTLSSLVLYLIGYHNFEVSLIFNSVINSLIINIIYGIGLYMITNYLSKKYNINKVD